MNDDLIKKIIEKDQKRIPQNKDEWSEILIRLDKEEESSFNISFLKWGGSFLCLFILCLGLIRLDGPQDRLSSSERKEILEYLIEDSYMGDEKSSYSWIEWEESNS